MVKSFYDTLGEDRLSDLLERFYDKVFASEIISDLFQNTPKEEIKRKQKLFLTQFLGGPSVYTETIGPPKMRQRHIPHKITVEAKDEWLRCMKAAISELDWDSRNKDALYSCFPKLAQHMVNSQS
ncbi:MAG: globin [Crocinitomicaceae bacterium]